MLNTLFPILVLVTTLGSAIMAGMFWTFSNFVMASLKRIDTTAGISAMQSINIVILNPLFFLIFMGTALMSITLPILAVTNESEVGNIYVLLGSASYLIGVMAVTITRNVPMNNALEAEDASSQKAHQLWQHYLVNWTRWNHIRSIGSLLSTLFFILALMA